MSDKERYEKCMANVKRLENGSVITILFDELIRRRETSDSTQLPMPFRKAMKQIAKMDFIIDNEHRALAVPMIGRVLAKVIKQGLISKHIYRNGTRAEETKFAEAAIQNQNDEEQKANEDKKSRKKSEKVYVPREGSATRAMLIVLGLERDANENEYGLNKEEIIEKARNYTDVDMIQAHDQFGAFPGWIGMKTLKDHQYVVKKKKLFEITEEGFGVFLEFCQPSNQNNNNDDNSNSNHNMMQEEEEKSLQRGSNNYNQNNVVVNRKKRKRDEDADKAQREEQSKKQRVSTSNFDHQLAKLISMGFRDDKSRIALQDTDSMEDAIKRLI